MILSVQKITKVWVGYEGRACACFFLGCFAVLGFGVHGVGFLGCCWGFFCHKESLISAELLLKQWIVVYFCGI